MHTPPRVSPEQFAESMKQEMEHYLQEVMEAVHQAADGEWLDHVASSISVDDFCIGQPDQLRNQPMGRPGAVA